MVVNGRGWTWMVADGCGWTRMDADGCAVIIKSGVRKKKILTGGQPACGRPMTLEVVVVVVVPWWQRLTVDVRTDTLHADG